MIVTKTLKNPTPLPCSAIKEFPKADCKSVEAGLNGDIAQRDDRWSESIAVGSEGFVE
jgi:hypothetical protein